MPRSRWSGIKDLSPAERLAGLRERTGLSEVDLAALAPEQGLSVDGADLMIENAIGVLGVPVGLATNFIVDGEGVFVPMATEEPSVVAAASNAARLAHATGGFRTSSTGPVMQAQVQVTGLPDPHGARAAVLEHREELMAAANEVDPVLRRLGGGCLDVVARIVETRRGTHLVVHLVVDVRDAMGANAVNTMAETLAPRIGELTGGSPLMRILTNKADRRLVTARAVFRTADIGGAEVAERILDAAALAEADPYRAATHNKGIMNGVSAVVLATGNDTRAVEAGCHAHAAREGGYTSLSRFEATADGDVEATVELPMPVGLVGGATRSNPTARAALGVVAPDSADRLGRIIAAVGLAQNFAAVRALADEGIQRGHMTLHSRTVAIAAGARPDEAGEVARRLVASGVVRSDRAEEILAELRAERGAQGG
ncbi:hydroxymethylglutaryl-CoA reductase, degradative [Sediminivirga luteola]|uniref:3-hydroxy-3-methylglutaryl coenzyme A reductase n=1 Tax=Sediminivirga luteola TaxID=1774748 RepID=A0A8J2XLS8_9MICO|nr:hydroxymethylglutaryl-CoA reductase, degradative [Sediminivirga luteola]MCI2265342.1 hydroxymethylglutaryl-CoA reductase, degradative [Sediminivirga luteola]GGA24687.1 3-hydroxy-3-methylglutaryl-CoA reductase [Sediminivirga luteola]